MKASVWREVLQKGGAAWVVKAVDDLTRLLP
jgi:hypothetical protein